VKKRGKSRKRTSKKEEKRSNAKKMTFEDQEEKRASRNVKILITVAVLIIAFLVVRTLTPEKTQKQVAQPVVEYKTCEERCVNNQECLKGCYITTINLAVLNSDFKKCDEIPLQESRQECIDLVYYKVATTTNDESKCNNIQNNNVKSDCFKNA